MLISLSAESVAALYGGCVMVSIFVHYFTLVAVMWMGAEALLMFQKLVYVFYKITTKFIIVVSIICWSKLESTLIIIYGYHGQPLLSNNCFAAVPSILVAIPLVVDLATGYNIESDIIVKRANNTKDIS